jgi:uncharacterized protein (DUF2384 family)
LSLLEELRRRNVLAREQLALPYLQRDFERAERTIADYPIDPIDPIDEQFSLIPKALLRPVSLMRRAITRRRPASPMRPRVARRGPRRAPRRLPGVSNAQALALLGRADPARAWLRRPLANLNLRGRAA